MLLVTAGVAVIARVAPLVAVAPFEALGQLPSAAQPALILVVSAWVLFSLPATDLRHLGPLTWGTLFGAAATNAIIGFAFALTARLLFSAFEVAGGYLDVVFGFSLSATLSPDGASTTMTQQFLTYFGTFVFLSLGGLTDMIAALSASFGRLPAMAPIVFGPAVSTTILGAFTTAVGVGMAVAAPLILAMALVNILVGALGRLIPQINLLAFDFPVLMAVGMLLFMISLPVWLNTAQVLLSDLGSAISTLVGAA
jgi:flagellar biosynthetic protein FliR